MLHLSSCTLSHANTTFLYRLILEKRFVNHHLTWILIISNVTKIFDYWISHAGGVKGKATYLSMDHCVFSE